MTRKVTDKQKANLKKFTSKEARENGKKGAIKSAEVRAEKRDKKILISALFDTKITKKNKVIKNLKKLFPDIKIETIEDLMDASMMAQAVGKGNVPAYQALNDRNYGKAPQSIKVETDNPELEKLRKMFKKETDEDIENEQEKTSKS